MAQDITILDPDSSAARQARRLALRLVAARLGAARTYSHEVYSHEVTAVMKEVDGNLELSAHLLNELTEAAWLLLKLTRRFRDEAEAENLDIDLDWLPSEDDETVLGFVEGWLNARGEL